MANQQSPKSGDSLHKLTCNGSTPDPYFSPPPYQKKNKRSGHARLVPPPFCGPDYNGGARSGSLITTFTSSFRRISLSRIYNYRITKLSRISLGSHPAAGVLTLVCKGIFFKPGLYFLVYWSGSAWKPLEALPNDVGNQDSHAQATLHFQCGTFN